MWCDILEDTGGLKCGFESEESLTIKSQGYNKEFLNELLKSISDKSVP